MPIYMDSHIVPGVEAKHAAEAHKKDLEIQERFCCRNMTYWIDEDKGRVFCLIDAPNEQAVREMHDQAHGIVPHEIIPVNSKVVEAFLGRIDDPEPYFNPDDPTLKVFNDPAFRVIMAIKIKDAGLLHHDLGSDKTKRLLSLYYGVVKDHIAQLEGSEVETKGESFVVSFASVSQAVECAIAIQKALHVAAELIDLGIGLHAGLPVDDSDSLFGKTLRLSNYLCTIGDGNRIVLSSIVGELNGPDFLKNSPYPDSIKRLTATEDQFLDTFVAVLEKNSQDPEFGIHDFCKELSISKSKLYRKCTGITGKSPNALIREHRLMKSLQLLGNEGRNVSQTAYETGFNSPSYFIKCFQQRFGLLPLSYSKLKT